TPSASSTSPTPAPSTPTGWATAASPAPAIDAGPPRRYPSGVSRPLITANQVTFARLILLPIGTWLLYRGVRGRWVALFAMTVVGCTDFVDGWLARRQGPTVLGGLMDPIADKVFVALIFLPAIDLGWLPWWMVTILFVREFVVTAARSSYERRDIPL